MNTVATPCIMAVPSILMVVPRGMVNEATEFLTPSFFSTIPMVTGMVAALLAVLNANIWAARILRMKIRGFKRATRVNMPR